MSKKMRLHLICLLLLGVGLFLIPFNVPAATQLPAPVLYQVLMAETAFNRGEPGIGLGLYLKASQESIDASIAQRATRLALEWGDIKTAIDPAKRWAALAPKNIEAQLTAAALFIRLDETKEALPYLKAVTELSPEAAEQHFIMLYTELQEDDKAKVVDALEKLHKANSRVAAIPIALSDIALQNGEFDKAFTLSKKAIKLSPNATNAQIVFAESLRHREGSAPTLVFIQEAMENAPDNAYLKNYVVQLYLSEGQSKEAFATLQSIRPLRDIPGTLLLQISQVCIQEKWLPEAEHFLNLATQTPEYADEAHYALGRLSELQQQYDVAIKQYQQLSEKSPLQANALMRSALLLGQDKKFDEALSVLQMANPQTADDLKKITLTQSTLLLQMRQGPIALESLNKTLRFIPNDPDLLFARGRVYANLGQYESAQEDLSTVFSMYPNNPDIAVHFGQVLWKLGKQEKASLIWKEALEQTPNDALLQKTMLEFKVK